MSNILKLVLTDHWFEEIKSGRKTHEYRMATIYWKKRLMNINHINEKITGYSFKPYTFVEFQKAYRKNPERMTFIIKTDLHCPESVFDIELGKCIKCQK